MPDRSPDHRAAIERFVEQAYAALDQISYYQILGVGTEASNEELRGSYYRLASRLHPDLHGDWVAGELRHKLTAVYSRVVEAYKTLTHGERRAQYDSGLGAGCLRWDADAAAKPRIRRDEDSIEDPGARKFFLLGRKALLARDGKAAVMNLRLAKQMAAGNAVIESELEKAEALAKSQGAE